MGEQCDRLDDALMSIVVPVVLIAGLVIVSWMCGVTIREMVAR